MSILIKNMEMPANCDRCWALDDYGDYPVCRITEEQRGYDFPIRKKRMDKCPLVPVPPSVYVRPVMRGSVFDKLVKILDTNCGYVDEEKAETVAKRLMRSGLIKEEKPQKWHFLFNALDGTPRYGCPVCKALEWRKTNFCPNCGTDMREES